MNKIFLRLIHWNRVEAKELAKLIDNDKYDIKYSIFSPNELRVIEKRLPSLFIIDLSRLPSQGRDLGIYLRKNIITRNIPILYIDGEQDKIKKIKQVLPDAYYSNWNNINTAIRNSLNQKNGDLVIPDSVFAGYQGVPLLKKLGLKPNQKTAIINPPGNIDKILGNLPEGIAFQKKINKPDLIIWFTASNKELSKKIKRIKSEVGKDGLWIVYPKKGSEIDSDLSQVIVRKTGLSNGLVDYKVCSVNDTWTGIKFAVRKKKNE